ncbi:N-acetylmuramoyl-L-alanine amidase [Myxococcaceae bacterium GXIMD 01537]
MTTIVIDPGHGGTTRVGGSSANNAIGPTGLLEKTVTLDLGLRLCTVLQGRGATVLLTRDSDVNSGLADRAHVARDNDADYFVSLHFNAPGRDANGNVDATINGTETWVHTNASADSRAFARRVQAATVAATGLRDRGVRAGALGVVNPASHDATTAACLVEVSFLTNTREEARLRTAAYLDTLANGIANGILGNAAVAPRGQAAYGRGEYHSEHSQQFDVWNEVPLVPQLTGMSCWAAAAAMLVGWRDSIPVEPEAVAHGSGAWAAYRAGLDPSDVPSLARAWGLTLETPRAITVDALRQHLEDRGPLWAGEASPGLHSVVVTGIYGDGTPDGTFVRINDPWPEGRGARYRRSFRDLMRNFSAAAGMDGIGFQLLHSGGRRGTSSRHYRHQESHTSRLGPDHY